MMSKNNNAKHSYLVSLRWMLFVMWVIQWHVGIGQVQYGSYANYGLRRMTPTYTGSLIQVRRGTDNATLNIGSTPCGGLDTVSLKSFLCGPNGFVTTWYDQSGNGRHINQTTNNSQPTMYYAGLYPPGSGWLDGYLYRKAIVISNTFVGSNLTNFPLLVTFNNDGDLGSKMKDLVTFKDIRFTSSVSSTIPYERESMSVSGGSVTGRYWVRVPSISSAASTTIYVYYGKPCDTDGSSKNLVWDANYRSVWHFAEGTGTVTTDSKLNTTATFQGSVIPTWTNTGVAGNALSFSGSGYLSLSGTPITGNSAYSIEAWFNTTATNTARGIVGWGTYGNNNQVNAYRIAFDCGGNSVLNYWWGNDLLGCTFSVTTNAWFYGSATYNGTRSLYKNGSLINFDIPGTASVQTGNYEIGRTNGSEYWLGMLDEVRISTIARSADWLTFCYQNMAQPNNCLSFGSEESRIYTGAPTLLFAGGRHLKATGILSVQPVSTSYLFNSQSFLTFGHELFGWGNSTTPGTRYGAWIEYSSSSAGRYGIENAGAAQITTNTFSPNIWYGCTQALPNATITNLEQAVNGAAQTMSTSSLSGPPYVLNLSNGEFAIGAKPASYSNGFNGYFRELNYYNLYLSQTRRRLIECNQAAFYNLSISNNKYTPPTSTSYVNYVNGIGRESPTDSVCATRQSFGMGLSVTTSAAEFLADDGDYLTCGMDCPITASVSTADLPSSVVERWYNDWYICKTDVGGNGGGVTIYFDFSDYGIANIPGSVSDYVLLARSSPSGNYSISSVYGQSIVGDQVRFWINAINVPNGYYTLGTKNTTLSPLPLDLVSFEGECKNNAAELTWVTSKDNNNHVFNVEKSDDGIQFSDFASVSNNSNADAMLHFDFSDKHPQQGLSYYRIKQLDADGSLNYSKIIAVYCDLEDLHDFMIYPNPSLSDLTVELIEKNTNCYLEILNVLGQTVFSGNVSDKITLPTNNFEKGIYLVKLQLSHTRSDEGTKIKKFVKD